jgi:hypothetical protein
MNDPERPPLDGHTFEKIKDAIHKVNQQHWPTLIEMQIPNYHQLNTPVPPQRPLYFRDTIVAYALDLFEREADFYTPFRTDFRYPPWLSRLKDRVIKQVLDALDKIEQGNPTASLWFHGVPQPEIVEAVRLRLWHATNQYIQRIQGDFEPHSAGIKATPQVSESAPPVRQRMSATIHAPSAAQKMKAYMNTKGLNQTEFAIQAGTTDKTIRKFRQTGKVKRSILDGIASAMGVSRQELLN